MPPIYSIHPHPPLPIIIITLPTGLNIFFSTKDLSIITRIARGNGNHRSLKLIHIFLKHYLILFILIILQVLLFNQIREGIYFIILKFNIIILYCTLYTIQGYHLNQERPISKLILNDILKNKIFEGNEIK